MAVATDPGAVPLFRSRRSRLVHTSQPHRLLLLLRWDPVDFPELRSIRVAKVDKLYRTLSQSLNERTERWDWETRKELQLLVGAVRLPHDSEGHRSSQLPPDGGVHFVQNIV